MPHIPRRALALTASVVLASQSLVSAAVAGDADDQRDAASDFIGNNYYDECDDGGSFDLKKFSIIDNEVDSLTYLWGTCPQTTVPAQQPDAAVRFWIDDHAQPSTPTLVVEQNAHDGSWVLWDTNETTNESAWDVIQQGVGNVTRVSENDGGPRDVGSIEIDAIAADFPLDYWVEVTTHAASDERDRVPERDMPDIRFPDGCDYFELQAAHVEVADGRAGLRAAEALGAVGAVAIARGPRANLAWPLDDRQLAALEATPGVTARRPVMFQALADPEPTQWAVDQVRLAQAWNAVPRAAGTIAVLDQGVDATRADLAGHVGQGFDGITNELYPAEHNSELGPHGTSVSGIAAGRRDNNTEVAGVNDGATIVPVRVFDHSSCADDRSIANGIDWAVSRGVDVINLSLGGPGDSDVLRASVEAAHAAGTIIVAATGNDDEVAPGRDSYPAAYDEVIGIGATGPGGVAPYSQRAATEFVAPGGAFSGQRASDYAVLSEWDRIDFQAGTSFAAPFVAGLVSLWLSQHPGASTEQVRQALREAAVDLGDPDDRDGFGLIDAVLLLGDTPPPPPPPPDPEVEAAPAIDEDPDTSHRLNSQDAVEAALAVSALRFPEAFTADVAVIARNDTFADALSGAPLSRHGPMLFTPTDALDERVANELFRTLQPDATIYLLGGPNALSPAVEQAVRESMPEAVVRRLAGTDRFRTSRIIVAETVQRHGLANQILLARGFGPLDDANGSAAWADAIAAAPFAASRGWPLLIVPTGGMTQADLDLIEATTVSGALVNLLGGPNALRPAVLDQATSVRQARRVWGPNRDATAAAIATTLWGAQPGSGPATQVLLNIRDQAGWYLGLASAGYAAEIGAPMLSVTASTIPAETSPFLERCGPARVETWVAGTTIQLAAATLAEVERRDGQSCT